MATFYSPRVVTDGLVLALDAANPKSYPKTGTSWTDLTGNGYSGNLVGLTTFASNVDRFETNVTAITDNGYLSTSSLLSFADQSAYSFEFWIKMRTNALATFHSLLGRGSTNRWLLFQTNNTAGTSWRIQFRDTSAVYNPTSYFTGFNVQQNWIHITTTFDSSRVMRVYANGVFLEFVQLPTSSLFDFNRIGGGYSSGGNFYNFQGAIGTFKTYTKTLSADEVLQNFNATRSRFGI